MFKKHKSSVTKDKDKDKDIDSSSSKMIESTVKKLNERIDIIDEKYNEFIKKNNKKRVIKKYKVLKGK